MPEQIPLWRRGERVVSDPRCGYVYDSSRKLNVLREDPQRPAIDEDRWIQKSEGVTGGED